MCKFRRDNEAIGCYLIAMLPAATNRHLGRRIWRISAAIALSLACALLLGAPRAIAGDNTEIRVPIVGIRSGEGTIFVALYQRDAWLEPHRFVTYRKVQAHRGSVYASFHGVKPGQYGIAVFHDENENGRVDTNVLGLPKEGYGFSRITPRRKPRFDEVAFDVRPLGHAHVQLRY